MYAQRSIHTLLQWCASQGFDIDRRLQIRPDANGGVGVYMNQDSDEIEPGTTGV
jgi:hypothetical protein